MPTPFTFSIRQAVKDAWALFMAHPVFFIGTALVSAVFNIATGKHIVLTIIAAIAAIVWAIVWKKITLAAARNQTQNFSWTGLQEFLPSVKDVVMVVIISIVGTLLVVCGLVILIIPGIYIGVRLSFASLAYIDRREGVQQSLRYSWNITKGPQFWTILLTGIVALALYLLGALLIGVGLLVTYPIAGILIAKLYVALSDHYNAQQTIVAQPTEIPADLSEAETVS